MMSSRLFRARSTTFRRSRDGSRSLSRSFTVGRHETPDGAGYWAAAASSGGDDSRTVPAVFHPAGSADCTMTGDEAHLVGVGGTVPTRGFTRCA